MERGSRKEILYLRGIRAGIFDMDGTMIDNMPYHDRAWQMFLKRHRLNLTPEERQEKITSRRNYEIFGALFGDHTPESVRETFSQEKEAIYRELYHGHVIAVPGLLPLISQLKNRNLKLAVATTAPLLNRIFGLSELGLSDSFDAVIGSEDVNHGKPHPEIYLKTAERLGIPSSECVVFEDSPLGVEAARKAGMRVVGISTSHTREELKGAEIVVPNFKWLAPAV